MKNYHPDMLPDQKVFSTVIKEVKRFVSMRNPDAIIIEGGSESPASTI